MATTKTQQRGFIAKLKSPFLSLGKLLRDVWNELQRVVWPSHEETYSFTIVVIIAVIVVAAWVGFWDLFFVKLVSWLGLYGH